jgi:beta-mannosidase
MVVGHRLAGGGPRIAGVLESVARRAAQLRVAVGGHQSVELRDGWELTSTPAGACQAPAELRELQWHAVRVPCAASDLPASPVEPGAAGLPDLDDRDWWFRARFPAPRASGDDQVVLVFGGVATVWDAHLNGRPILSGESMFGVSAVDVTAHLGPENELLICCRALGPLLAVSRRPRARWRTRVVADGGLRFYRTMLLGRAPGFAPGPPVIGPWRPVLLEVRREFTVSRLRLRAQVGPDGSGTLTVDGRLESLGRAVTAVAVEVEGPAGVSRTALETDADGSEVACSGTIEIPHVALWWPHTHGEPSLYSVALCVTTASGPLRVDCGRVGFRQIGDGGDIGRNGLQLTVNDVPVFVRGAVWTPLEAAGRPATPDALRTTLEAVRAAGMNMVRIPGTAAYESAAFHDLCDELGLLVWQDFMFANLDYPQSDEAFLDLVRDEILQVLDDLAGRPSLAVLCGSSEIAQQVAMLGLDVDPIDGPLFGDLLPRLIGESGIDCSYVPTAPWGGARPFRPDTGIANYYGVGGYRRPLEDVRRSNVRFAAECLAFSNVPDRETLDASCLVPPGGLVAHHPRWKEGVPRDSGAGWDFEDVRDHYLLALYGIDAAELRRTDHEHYLDLSRAVSGEVMEEVFGEWRRASSGCGGGLVLWLSDLRAGAGWGLLDNTGRPKVPYHHLRRLLAPLSVWSTDEGLAGIAVHIANDGPREVRARLRVGLYRDQEVKVGEAITDVQLEAHSGCEYDVEELLGHFVDVSWAYRFGPPSQDVVALSLEAAEHDPPTLLSQSFRLPAGRSLRREPAGSLGLAAEISDLGSDGCTLRVRSRRFARCVRVHLPGYTPDDDAFSIEPGYERLVHLRRDSLEDPHGVGALTALNLDGRVAIAGAERL